MARFIIGVDPHICRLSLRMALEELLPRAGELRIFQNVHPKLQEYTLISLYDLALLAAMTAKAEGPAEVHIGLAAGPVRGVEGKLVRTDVSAVIYGAGIVEKRELNPVHASRQTRGLVGSATSIETYHSIKHLVAFYSRLYKRTPKIARSL